MAKYIRRKEIKEEIVEAEVSALPSSVSNVVNGQRVTEMVHKGDYVVTYNNGKKEVYPPETFKGIFTPVTAVKPKLRDMPMPKAETPPSPKDEKPSNS